ncbi:MAG TPA: response regulator [Dehalococcoidia bacterium]|jgi:two-component system alkaline phosphatase synthesis response regulator PhoP|nr:response regulator [Dehalococcoidia bacterium]
MVDTKILIVDDEVGIRLMVVRMLGEDYTVLEAADGEEAVTLTRLHKPSLVLMDILMPGKDGYSACHEIKTDLETRSTPVVMVSAIGHKLNERLSAEVGADGYITKPFSVEKLLEAIAKYARGST